MQFSNTPKTDKFFAGCSPTLDGASDFCRKMECDLNSAHESINVALRGDASCAVLMERIEELKFQNKQLLDVAKHLAKCDYQSGYITIRLHQSAVSAM